MAHTTPRVSDGVLAYTEGTLARTVEMGSADWRRWLDDAGTTTFRVLHHAGAYTARKERRRRGGAYLYAYRKQGGRLDKRYLGRSEDLTRQRLDHVAEALAAGKPAPSPETAPSGGMMSRHAIRPPRRAPVRRRMRCWQPSSSCRLSAPTWCDARA